MVFGINDNVDHNTYLSWNYVVCRIEEYAFFQMVLERNICTFDTWINHITGHHFQSLIQVLSEFLIWPMQVPDEGLERIELPEQIFWCGTTISKKGQIVDKYFFTFYKPGQANLQLSLCQSLEILIINTFICGIFSKIKIQGLQNDQNCRFWLPEFAKLDLM